MLTTLLASALIGPATPLTAAPLCVDATPAATLRSIDDTDVDQKIQAAGEDVDKLLAMAEEYRKASDRASAKKVFERVIEIDTDNETARKGLRHQFYDGQWFTSYVALSKYKREEAKRMKEKGLVKWKDEWVTEKDLPYLQLGWTQLEDGSWAHPADLARDKAIEQMQAEGYRFRADDNSWVSPDEMSEWEALKFKCGEEWLELAKADEFHATLPTAWQLASDHFIVFTPHAWGTANQARQHAESTYEDLMRIFGVAPEERRMVAVLRSLDEYKAATNSNVFAESEGHSSVHFAYFSDLFVDRTVTPPKFRGGGVAYWDVNSNAAGWGPFGIRWAAAQSYIEGIDPSFQAVASLIGSPEQPDPGAYATSFWGEKAIPRWLRYGAATYVERFLEDDAPDAEGDRWRLRNFSISELGKLGGMLPAEEVFAFNVDPADPAKAAQLFQSAGLMVAYLVDGSPDEKVTAAHEALKEALRAGDRDAAIAASATLQEALAKSKDAIAGFAGL
ncbi:MAG: hypothetical protein AAF726_14560 [Planctomycetota bacterium]